MQSLHGSNGVSKRPTWRKEALPAPCATVEIYATGCLLAAGFGRWRSYSCPGRHAGLRTYSPSRDARVGRCKAHSSARKAFSQHVGRSLQTPHTVALADVGFMAICTALAISIKADCASCWRGHSSRSKGFLTFSVGSTQSFPVIGSQTAAAPLLIRHIAEFSKPLA